MENHHSFNSQASRLKGWGKLFLGLFLLWAFTFHAFPWIKVHIPGMMTLDRAIEARDIDTTTFFYSETKESYEAETYLNDTLGLLKPNGYDGFDFYFIMGIVLCFTILFIGFRLMPTGRINESKE